MTATGIPRFQAFELLATPVAVVQGQGHMVFANAALEDAVGVSRRHLVGAAMPECFVDAQPLRLALEGARANRFATLRYEAKLHRLHHTEALPVHVIVSPTDVGDEVVVQLLPVEQQTRQEREERWQEQAQANKELVRNLAHEIKNPLGGIRGSAQLLELELDNKALHEYTQVIVREADRLQLLMDRLLAPHRHPRVVSDVNIHEVCERVRTLIMAEFPRGLQWVRDYDISIPEFRGDREQLIQAVLNIAHNAAQALQLRREQGDACITLKTRIVRQATLGKQRHKLALELLVQDNGPGVPSAIRDRIFAPLVSGREGGTGLGLTLAQTFVQQHHGAIGCNSAPGQTQFNILIPLP